LPSHIAEEFYSSTYPTISAGLTTKLIIVSTPNGMNHFHKLWVDANRPEGHKLKNKFIPNNCSLDEEDIIWLITGPNMAGKSTFLRQNAIICILAQIGSFVPAKNAHIGVVDKLFSRIGASDNISSGQSTFMVEMLETANIANNATDKSLIIMDEVGRGTSTYDGLAIAQAVVEYVHNKICARMLFATHYHEMCDLEHKLTKLSCHTMKVAEWDGKITFMHEVIEGRADKSYGVHVAQLAGMPSAILQRAYDVLNHLENNNTKEIDDKPYDQSVLKTLDISDAVCKMMSSVDINSVTPRSAMDLLFQLKDLTNEI
jgi:DNA mismatch repair protein MutS